MSLDPLFKPRSIAIIGASARPLTIGHRILTNLMEHGFNGPLFPVNPKGGTINNLMVYSSIKDIPVDVDLVHIIVKNSYVKPTLIDCAEKGVKVAIVNTSGFREMGPKGEELENDLIETGKKYGIRIFGPNCQGVMNTDKDISLYSNFTFAKMYTGHISVLAQGGGVAEVINNYFGMNKVGTRMYASNGNAADISTSEILEYYGNDPETRVIVMHVESFRDPQGFLKAAKKVAAKKPILALKSGYTEEGAKAVSSHTGGLMGQDTTSDILFDKAGVLRFKDLTTLCETAKAFAGQPVPSGDNVGIVTNAGSPAIIATDEAVHLGLKVPELSDKSKVILKEKLKGFAAVANPIDMAATASADEYGASIKALLDDENIDSLIISFITPFFVNTQAIAMKIAELSKTTDKTIVCVAMTNENWNETVDIIKRASIPVYYFPEAASHVLAQMSNYRKLRERSSKMPEIFQVNKDKVSNIINTSTKPDGFLSDSETFSILKHYGIPTVKEQTVLSYEEMKKAAENIGYPVVLKINSDKVIHKTDSGGVILNIFSETELRNAHNSMCDNFNSINDIKFTLQKQIEGGVEVIIGSSLAPDVGHSLMFGLGGVFVEVMKDVIFKLAPLSKADAYEMLNSIKAHEILNGVRGQKPLNKSALTEILYRISQMVLENPEITELDLNPIIVKPEQENTVVVDARIRVKKKN